MAERTSWGPSGTASADSTASDHLLPYTRKNKYVLSDCYTCSSINPLITHSNRCLSGCIIVHASEGGKIGPRVCILKTRTLQMLAQLLAFRLWHVIVCLHFNQCLCAFPCLRFMAEPKASGLVLEIHYSLVECGNLRQYGKNIKGNISEVQFDFVTLKCCGWHLHLPATIILRLKHNWPGPCWWKTGRPCFL